MKILFTFLLFFCFVQISFSQTLTAEQVKSVKDIQALNTQLLKYYEDKNFDEALKIGKDIFSIAAKDNLMTDTRVLTAVGNLGAIYLAKKKESEAIRIYQMLEDIYRKLDVRGKKQLEEVIDQLGVIYFNQGDFKNAEEQFNKLLRFREIAYGMKSRQVAQANLKLAETNQMLKKYEMAETYYIKAIEMNDEVLKAGEQSGRIDVEKYECFCYHRGFREKKLKEVLSEFKSFNEKRKVTGEYKPIREIVNGKALNLVRPKYPGRALSEGSAGFVVVSVEIDERGNVTKATAKCGYLDFVKAVEEAALKSKFTPTLINGIPVKSAGDIVYSFSTYFAG